MEISLGKYTQTGKMIINDQDFIHCITVNQLPVFVFGAAATSPEYTLLLSFDIFIYSV